MFTLADILLPLLRGIAVVGRGAIWATGHPARLLPVAMVTGMVVLAAVISPLPVIGTLLGFIYVLGLSGGGSSSGQPPHAQNPP